MRRKLTNGLTSVTLPVFVKDTNGSALGNLTYNSSGLWAAYRRQGQTSWTSIPLVTTTLGNWTSGGFVADGNVTGLYELQVPDAAVAAGARWCAVVLAGAATMKPCLNDIEIDQVNYQDAVRFGLSALPNANASTSGGLITSGNGTGQITLSSGAVVVGTNNDKTGYQLANATLGDGKTLITSGNGTAQLAVSSGAVELTTATNAAIAAIANSTSRIPSDPATESTVLSVGNTTIVSIPSVVAIRAEMDANSTKLAYLDQPISTRLAAANYTAPDNSTIASIANATARIPASPASAGNVTDAANATVATLQGNITSDGNTTRALVTSTANTTQGAITTDGNLTRAALVADGNQTAIMDKLNVIGNQTALITSGAINVIGPVLADGETVQIVRGDDYTDGRIAFSVLTTDLPDLSGATVAFTARQKDARGRGGDVSAEANVTVSTSGNYTLFTVPLTGNQTETMAVGARAHVFDVEIMRSGGKPLTPIRGELTVLEDETR